MNQHDKTLFRLADLFAEWTTHKAAILNDYPRFMRFYKEYMRLHGQLRTFTGDEPLTSDLVFFMTYGCAGDRLLSPKNATYFDPDDPDVDDCDEALFDLNDALERFLDKGHFLVGELAFLWGGFHKEHRIVWRCRDCPDRVDVTRALPSFDTHWHSWRYPPNHGVSRPLRKQIRQGLIDAGYDRAEEVQPFYERLAK